MPLPTFRRHSFPLQKARSAKLFLFLLFNSSLKQSQSKLPHREGPSRLFLLHHIQLWEKVPGHAMGFSRGMRKRAAIDASTPAAHSLALSSHNRRLSPLPSALRMCAVGSLAGLSLGRLACKGDEDMSPWPSTGGWLWGLLACVRRRHWVRLGDLAVPGLWGSGWASGIFFVEVERYAIALSSLRG